MAQDANNMMAVDIKYHYDWSAEVQEKSNNIICIGFQNINGVSKLQHK
jgi:hypothetical protein